MTCPLPTFIPHVKIHPYRRIEVGESYILSCKPGYCADGGEVKVTCSEEIARYGYDDDENLVTCRQDKEEDGVKSGASCLHDEHYKLGFEIYTSLIWKARSKVSVRMDEPLDPKASEEKLPLWYNEYTAMLDCNVCLDRICGKMFERHDIMIQRITGFTNKYVGCAVNSETRVGACEYVYY